MLRSLYAGISGLRQHQTMMDTVGNNIANVNTAGFKSSAVVFEDTLSQMLKAPGAPDPRTNTGGSNPAQVGLGVRLGAITTNFTQGAAQSTGRSTDLMIQGDGFFAVKQAGETLYTRAGAFNFDANGWLVNNTGAKVQGWMATNGAVDVNTPVADLKLPVGTLLEPKFTESSVITGNLPAADPVGTVISSTIKMYDDQGNSHDVTYRITKSAANSWGLEVLEGATSYLSQALTFDPATGALTTASPATAAAAWGPVSLDFSGLTQFGGANTFAATEQDGWAMGSLQAFTLGNDGTITGVFSNGLKQTLGQVALANFNNPTGLEKIGGSLYRTTVNSGLAQVGTAGNGGRGLLASGSLEMSNVDLGTEFTNLIVAQRGFQANSRVITASDEILSDLVNIKR